MFRRDLRRRYVVPPTPGIADKPLFWGCAAVCLLLGPAFLTGVAPAWPATAGAVLLLILFAVRRPSVLLWRDRCRAAGVEISWRSFLWRGAILVPAVLVASVAALVV